jgi:tRNA/tmRNA/rRNA uracil-C5-methylase (TrmA/RlmC/RlmD family)
LNTRRDNRIFGDTWQHLFGEEWLVETVLGKQVCYHPESFMQANPAMFEKLLRSVAAAVPKKSKVIEFYAGVGAIGLSLLDQCSEVACVEVVPSAKASFEASLSFLSAAERERLSFYPGTAVERLSMLQEEWDAAIVDPPRKGLEKQVIEALCSAISLSRLIYISCGWESFKRDCTVLLNGPWKLARAEAFLFFPGSEHIELLAIFDWKK